VLSQSGNLILQTTGINGCEAFDTLTVTVDALPNVPQITIDGAYLVASADGELQWFQDDQPIDGETGDSLAIPGNGNYSVEVTNTQGCVSISEIIEVNVTSNSTSEGKQINVFPIPFSDEFWVSSAELSGKNYQVIDGTGRVVLSGRFESDQSGIKTNTLKSGIYMLIPEGHRMVRLLKVD
jgi:hypothetical protein